MTIRKLELASNVGLDFKAMPQWGLNGYFKMTQDWFLDSRRLVDDLWVIRKVK